MMFSLAEELRGLCRQLKPLIGPSADSLWTHYQLAENLAARAEAESMIRMMAVSYLGAQVDDRAVRLPPSDTLDTGGDIFLGDIRYPGRLSQPLYLHSRDLVKHTGIFATTGSGKTHVAYNLLQQFVKNKIPFLVIDWKRSYRNLKSLPGMQDLDVFTVGRDASPFLWNPLRPPPNVHPQTWIQILADVLEKTHVSGQGVADVLAELADMEFEAKGFYADPGAASEYPNFFDLKNQLDRRKYSGRKALWRDSCLRILRTFVFGPASKAFNARHPVHLEDLLDKPVILELDLELPKTVRTFFTETILRWIHLYRLSQGETDRLRHVLVLEEAHNIFPAPTYGTTSNGGLENVYREIRSFGQALVAITQHPSMLPIYVLGNTHTLIFMALTHEADIISARQALFLERNQDAFLDRLGVGEGIVKIKGRLPPTHVQFQEIHVQPGAIKDEDLKS
ncbi:MAG: DUF87 domain-containing protein [Kiritimatiellales bacterium]